MRAEYVHERPEGRGGAFLFHEERRVNLVRRVVHRHDQVHGLVPRQPFVPGTVLMQHHSGQRTTRPLAPMRPPTRRALQQAFRLQQQLRPGVAPAAQVIAHQVLVEMPRREAQVAGPIETFDLRLVVRRHPFGRRPAQAAIQQTGFALFLVTAAPTTEGSLADAQQLARLDLVEFARLMTVQHAPETDHSHTLKGFRPAHPGSPKSSDSPDRSRAT